MTLRHFIELLGVKVGANLRSEVSRYYLNYLWWIIEPIMTMLVFYLIFVVFLNNRMPNFVGFLLVGLVVWNWLSHSVTNGMNCIVQGRALMLKRDIVKLFFPLVELFQDAFKHLFVQALLLVFLVFYPILWARTGSLCRCSYAFSSRLWPPRVYSAQLSFFWFRTGDSLS